MATADATTKVILPMNSRLKDTNLYTDNNGDTFFNMWKRLEIEDQSDFGYYQLRTRDIGRLDLLAHDFYGDPTLDWVIMDFNSIYDPIFGMVVGQKIKIPAKDQVLRMLMN